MPKAMIETDMKKKIEMESRFGFNTRGILTDKYKQKNLLEQL